MSHDAHAAGNGVPGRSQQPRLDERQRDIVDRAIAVQESCNTLAAVEYMKGQDVQAAVIERVLGDPAHRRAPGPIAASATSAR